MLPKNKITTTYISIRHPTGRPFGKTSNFNFINLELFLITYPHFTFYELAYHKQDPESISNSQNIHADFVSYLQEENEYFMLRINFSRFRFSSCVPRLKAMSAQKVFGIT